MAQFFWEAEPKYARCKKRTFSYERATFGVRSVEKESTTNTSSHHRTDSTQSAMFRSSFNVVITAETRARGSDPVARSDI